MDESAPEKAGVGGEAGVSSQQRLSRERDRLKLLLDINNAVVSHLDLRELFKAISESLRKAIESDGMAMSILDRESGLLRIHSLDAASGSGPSFEEGEAIPLEGTPAGRAREFATDSHGDARGVGDVVFAFCAAHRS